ncbi:hypothetical protein WR25_25013 isoform J [Diploscapter pachys]|nr:hypothetical protein WR25_25013 isoform J [Diploscapter pachys]
MVAIEHPWHRWHPVPRPIVSDDGTMTTQVKNSPGMQTNVTFCIITRHFQKASFLLQDVLHLNYSMIFVNLPFFQNEDEGRIEKTVNLGNSGEATVTFSNEELKKYKLIRNYGGTSIRIVATVTEDLTGIERNSTTQVTVHKHDVKLSIEKQGDSFKPGLGYKVVLALKQMDDTPIKAGIPRRVQVSTFYNYPFNPDSPSIDEGKEVKIVDLDAHGMAVINVNAPLNCTSTTIQAHYDRSGKDEYANSEIFAATYVYAAKSPSISFLQVIPDHEGSVSVGKSLSFSIKATQKLSYLSYQVLARGAVILSKQLAMDSDHTTISFVATNQMAPKARLIVYSVIPTNQEILVDATDFKVEGIFRNNVSLSVDKDSAQPGESVTFTVKADPESLVSLLAVDQSVLLLKSGNDITADLVQKDIEEYDTTGRSRPWESYGFVERRKRFAWYPYAGVSGNDAATIFENAGLVVLTDAYLYKEPEQPMVQAFAFAEAAPAAVGGAAPPESFRAFNGEAADAAADSDGGNSAQIVLRQLFPETWVWSEQNIDANGEVSYEAKVPDTITSWVASAFAVNDATGLGVAPITSKLRVFRPFFIRLNLPYSVKRGEKFALQVLVFNYMDREQDVTLTLKHTEDAGFDFLNKDGSVSRRDLSPRGYNTRSVAVPSGASKAVYFPIVPTQIGSVKLTVTAQGSQAGDAVEMPLKVEPEGYRIDRNVPIFMDLTEKANENSTSAPSGNFQKTVVLDFPPDVVDGSKKATVQIIGDLMGPVLSSVDSLVRMPYGCGEQNMLNFVPNIVVMKYLRATNRNEKELERKALKYMEAGYQRELTYKRFDNSFSAFGESDEHGSTWLTAFVVRSFSQAKPFIYVDDSVINKSIAFLNAQQMESGAFAERGQVHHKDMQGGASDGGLALTAYVVVALLENGVRNERAITFLEKNLDEAKEDVYTMAVVNYALTLANSGKKDVSATYLNNMKIDDKEGTTHWEKKRDKKQVSETTYFYQPPPADIETTSYALLSLMKNEDTEKALPVVRWLIQQRNSLGGFSSTQDTVLALQAISTYAEKTYSAMGNITVQIANGADNHQFKVGRENALVLQTYELTNPDNEVVVKAIGNGVVFAQVSYSYYRNSLLDDVPFFCTKDLKELRGGNRLQLELCCNYTRANAQSNMAVAALQSLSGFKFDEEEMNLLTQTKGLQRVELEDDDTLMNVYFNGLTSTPICMNVYSDMVYQVAEHKPAQVSLYDYYDPEQQIKLMYSSKAPRSLADSCADCWPAAEAQESAIPRATVVSAVPSAGLISSFILSICSILCISLIRLPFW